MNICTYVYRHVVIHMYIYIYIYIYLYVHIYVWMYMSVYKFIRIHIRACMLNRDTYVYFFNNVFAHYAIQTEGPPKQLERWKKSLIAGTCQA